MGLLDGRVAIVTGAGRGLGRAHALTLAAAGAAVVVNDYGAGLGGEQSGDAPADEVVKEIIAAGGSATSNPGSVGRWDDCVALIEQAVSTYGRLDIVVNNAGITRDHMITSSTEQDFDDTINVHLKGTWTMCNLASRHWRDLTKTGELVSGRIINTTSGAGFFGNIGQTAYSAAKAGIIGTTLSLAMEMERYGVTANVISPVALTRMTENLMKSKEVDGFEPLDPANASGVVAYLGSEEAGWLTGQVLRIEGDTVVRMQGWASGESYRSPKHLALTPDELVRGARLMYGLTPRGVTTVDK